ncbi:MAG: amidohydrolase [Planctomycetaceae bacterium]
MQRELRDAALPTSETTQSPSHSTQNAGAQQPVHRCQNVTGPGILPTAVFAGTRQHGPLRSRILANDHYKRIRDMPAATSEGILAATKEIEPWMIAIRRRLHQCPELLYDLHETSQLVCDELKKLDIPFETGIAETGIVATIGSDTSRCVMLRADMDALPIEETADVEFKSRNAGVMHACGHDCHTAMLLGAAKVLKHEEPKMRGTVKLCFQPAEEGGAGGKRMCEAGVMENPTVEKALAIHVWPMIPSGQLTGCPGTFLASTSAFEIKVAGKGGHAAMPHFSIDPIVTAAKIISSIQTLISREQDPMEAGVVSITAVNGGSAFNVIPPEVTLKGTIRSLSSANKDHLKERLAEVARSMAAADRCTAEFETIGEDYPETSNDPVLWNSVREMGRRIVGQSNFPVCSPTLGGEDFSYYGAHAPTCFVGVGCGNESEGCTFGLHHPQFKMDESVLHIGTALHVAFVNEHL